MTDKLKRESTEAPISIILVSGIPGAGKSRFASSLTKELSLQKLKAASFKMPTIESSLKYSTLEFVEALSSFIKSHPESSNLDVIVAALPSYHHLKKSIFELRKSESFTEQFDIKFVVTKVLARNFYQNRHRNTFQFLIENCMKGISSAIVLETASMPPREIDIMLQTLRQAHFEQGVLPIQGKAFDLEKLSQILMRQNEKFNMLYTKYFYGFEKEGSSQYYLDKSVTGHHFNYKYRIKEELLTKTLMQMLCTPINDVSSFLPKPQEVIQKEEEEKEKEQKKKS